MWSRAKKIVTRDSEAEHAPLEQQISEPVTLTDKLQSNWETFTDKFSTPEDTPEKIAERAWKAENPTKTLKKQRQLLKEGKIEQLPWNRVEFRERIGAVEINTSFGQDFPPLPGKGDIFLRTDRQPTVLYKFNGIDWIEVDKDLSDSYTYNTAYIDFLIDKISTGEYDPELLNENERISIEQRLNQNA
jgi:hypothetical protein